MKETHRASLRNAGWLVLPFASERVYMYPICAGGYITDTNSIPIVTQHATATKNLIPLARARARFSYIVSSFVVYHCRFDEFLKSRGNSSDGYLFIKSGLLVKPLWLISREDY